MIVQKPVIMIKIALMLNIDNNAIFFVFRVQIKFNRNISNRRIKGLFRLNMIDFNANPNKITDKGGENFWHGKCFFEDHTVTQ